MGLATTPSLYAGHLTLGSKPLPHHVILLVRGTAVLTEIMLPVSKALFTLGYVGDSKYLQKMINGLFFSFPPLASPNAKNLGQQSI